ncbi:MAG: hypothetical protein E6Q97_20305 [Desulfurellales bacterium]|nr:MAG: hypothetical protein E6Q97_20305 [Desulfurellales bacterium]
MTPLQLNILLHYYSCANDYRDGDFTAPAVREAIDWFYENVDMLEINNEGSGLATYRITERGRDYIETVLAVPLERQVRQSGCGDRKEAQIERLRAALEWITENGPDDAWDLRDKAREALTPNA